MLTKLLSQAVWMFQTVCDFLKLFPIPFIDLESTILKEKSYIYSETSAKLPFTYLFHLLLYFGAYSNGFLEEKGQKMSVFNYFCLNISPLFERIGHNYPGQSI